MRGSALLGGPLAERFELRQRLGAGGMGVVFRAWDRALGKEVALKRMLRIGATQAQRLKAEFRVRSALQHRSLVQLYDLVTDGDDCFFTMELVEGKDLASWVRAETIHAVLDAPTREAPPPLDAGAADDDPDATEVVAERSGERDRFPTAPSRVRAAPPIDPAGVPYLRAALAELCSGLAVLHEAGIVHCDVTPGNVLVTPNGRVVLLDFGLAAPAKGAGKLAGTLKYMAPEQVRAETVTPAVDLYAVGGIVYELLTGRVPLGETVHELRRNKAAGARPPPIERGGELDELAELAMALLDPDPAARPDAREVLRRLSAHGAVRAVGPTFGVPLLGELVGRREESAALAAALRRVVEE